MSYPLQYRRFNESSILIEWPALINEKMLKNILFYKKSIQEFYIKEKVEVVNTYNSLFVIYNSTIEDVYGRVSELKALFSNSEVISNLPSNLWQIPVCYDDEFAVDLESYSNKKKFSKSEIIKLHTAPIYTIFFIGFLPGFLYLGGLNSDLYLDRKKTPNLNVKKGSVGIGGKQTGIYPKNSPGGWHIIGNSPVEFFNPKIELPCQFQSGDQLQFVQITKEEHREISNQIKHSEYQLKPVPKK